jgi:hypothetical protein
MNLQIQGLGQRALKKTILAALLLASVNAAHAVINIDVSFDGRNTLMVITGAWDSFPNPSEGDDITGSSGPAFFTNLSGPFSFSASGPFVLVSGSALPSFDFTPFGAPFGFDQDFVYAPVAYSHTNPYFVSNELAGDMFDLATNPNQGGIYAGGGNTLSWSAIPEPSTYAALFGCVALVVVIVRRRRG